MGHDGFTVEFLWAGDRLVLGCFCGAITTLTRADLILLCGAEAPLDGIGLRVRCARCAQPPIQARFEWARDRDEEGEGDAGGGSPAESDR